MFRNARVVSFLVVLFAFAALLPAAFAQSTSAIQGTVMDSSGAVLPNAKISVQNQGTGEERVTQSDSAGNYDVPSLPVGTYRIMVSAPGMKTEVVKDLPLEVARTVRQDFKLPVASVQETIEIEGVAPVIDSTGVSVGQVVNKNTVQQIPLNGRHFVDMGLLIAGSVTPPQVGNLTAPLRGQGSFSFNTAGNREDAVNFMINGINLNDMSQNQITFQPSINTVQEFKVDNQTYGAEYGRNSGAIVNIATRSGSNGVHGEIFEFVRNHVMDARNFFNKETITDNTGALVHNKQSTFKRNNFGGAIGGPIWKDHTFYFLSYEALRQRQGVDTSAGVLTPAQRAAVTSPVTQQLLQFIPLANSGSAITPTFIGSSLAPVNIDQGTADISHTFNSNDRLHGYYAIQQDLRQEPILQGNTLPGWGDTRQSRRQIFTLNETHVFSPQWVNEARLGYNRIFITFQPNVKLNPTTFGISDGVTTAIGLPQIQVNPIGLNFGGPSGFPQGRGDLTSVLSDTVSWLHGNHNIKFGGEFRRFNGNSFTGDTARFSFTSPATFGMGNANQFVVTPGNRPSRITANALGFFAVDSYKVRPNFTLELGVRMDWNMSPTEARDRFVNFDPKTSSLVRVGHEVSEVYNQNIYAEPRVGFAWDLFHDGKTILRSAYGYTVDQPTSNLVTPLTSNPPFSFPINFGGPGTLNISNAFATVTASNILSVNAINHNLKNANVQQWNLNVQQQITPTLGIMVGYFGSKGTHLRVPRNLNQILFNVSPTARPFTTLVGSQSVPCSVFAGGVCPTLGNIPQLDGAANSNYNALWATATKRVSRGLEFSAAYTYSKSLDYNSLGSQQGTTVPLEDSNNPRLNYGLSDYDARHRFVLSGIYDLPFRGNRVIEGWQFATITQLQTGNPVNVVTTSGLTGTANTVRPDLLGRIGTVDQITAAGVQWFTNNGAATVCNGTTFLVTSNCLLFTPSNRFGNMRRNALVGPGFETVDLSLIKNTKITERLNMELRVEFFNIVNHPNFGQPNTPGSVNAILTPGQTNFGVITSTRFPTGDSGSARQIQFAIKFKF